jgi:hypothetical protein
MNEADEVEGEDEEEIKPGPLICVTCGADDVVPVVWGFAPPGEEVPGLMRTLNLCETCRDCVGKAILGTELRGSKRTARDLRRHLRDLVRATSNFLDAMDRLMQQPASAARGGAIAKRINRLNFARDVALRFGLDGRP